MKPIQSIWRWQTTIFLLPCLCFVGCSKKSEQADQDDVDTVLSDAAKGDQQKPAQPDQHKPVSVAEANKFQQSEFASRVQKLTGQANAAEAKFDFKTALEHWDEVYKIVSKRFGEKAWQTTNVRLAIKTARQQSKFDNSQRRVLQTISQLQQKTATALRTKDNNEAYQSCHQASQLTKSLFGSQSYLYARMQNQLAHIAALNRQPELALSFYEAALSILKAEMGNIHPEVESTTFSIGQTYQRMGNAKKSISYLADSVNQSRQVWGELHLIYATRTHDLGVAYHQTKNYEQALKFLNISRQIRMKQLGNDHPQLAHNLRNLGVVYQDQMLYTKSTMYYDAACKIFMSRLGPENPFTMDCQTKLAVVLTMLKEYPKSEAILTQLAETQKKLWPNNPIYAQTLFRLATVQSYQAKYKQAEPLFKQALTIQTKELGDRHSETQKTIDLYATLLTRTGRESQAKQLRAGVRTAGNFEDEKQFQPRFKK